MKTVVVPSALYSAGTRTRACPLPVDGRFLGVGVILTRESWPNPEMRDLVTVTFERSIDDGVTWMPLGAFTFSGGEILKDDGTIDPVCGGLFKWRNRFGAAVLQPGRARLTITNRRPLRTELTLVLMESTD